VTPSRPERAKALMTRIHSIVFEHHEAEPLAMPPADSEVLYLYARLRSLLQAIRILLDNRLPAEAVILHRELFFDSLHLVEIAARGDDRVELLLGMMNKSLTEFVHFERTAQSLGFRTKEVVDVIEQRVIQRRREIDEYRARVGAGPDRRFPDKRALATEQDRLDELLDFELAHRFVHVAEIAVASRAIKDGEVLGLHLYEPDDDAIAAVAAGVMKAALHGHRAAASIFGWTETSSEEINELLSEIDTLFPPGFPDSIGGAE
jgi:hypothetical protein